MKKNPAEYDKITKEFFESVKEKKCDLKLCKYVWQIIEMSKGYGFNASHTLAYSIIGLQEINLAFKYPLIYWNCACLISNATSEDYESVDSEEDNIYKFDDEIDEEIYEDDFEDFYDITEQEFQEIKTKKKALKKKPTKYGKIAIAIGKIKKEGIKISLPDINKSSFTFTPDLENNLIRYGLSGIVRISSSLIKEIVEKRPYSSIEDFLNKVKVNKTQMINLIKSGAFDNFGDRAELLKAFVVKLSKPKLTLNLRNMQMLIKMNLLPQSLDFTKRVFNFNKYLKLAKDETYYFINDIAFKFYEQHFNLDLLEPSGGEFKWKIKQKEWEKIYKKKMDVARQYIKENLNELLEKVNKNLFDEIWNKDCGGNLSKWEMDSVSCYFHEHELAKVNQEEYSCIDFFNLPKEPIVETIWKSKGKDVPLFKINRIMGTVLDRNKTKKTVTLLTTTGVVTVKIFGQIFSFYDKQISEKGEDGKKHVIEKSLFTRGNKLIISGIRRGDCWIAKKYKRTPWDLVNLIAKINNSEIELYCREEEEW